jgi:hypothetical protein
MYDVRDAAKPYRPSPAPGRPSQATARQSMEEHRLQRLHGGGQVRLSTKTASSWPSTRRHVAEACRAGEKTNGNDGATTGRTCAVDCVFSVIANCNK